MLGKWKKRRQDAPDSAEHESGYVMRAGERLVAAQEATSPEGGGWLLATSMAFYFIHHRRGIYLYLDHSMIKSLEVDKGRIAVKWDEGGRQFEFRVRLKGGPHSPGGIAGMLNRQFCYSTAAFRHVRLDDADIAQARQERAGIFSRRSREVRSDIKKLQEDKTDKQEGRLRALQRMESVYRANARHCKTIEIVRSARVPAHISLRAVWNDCYYDGKRGLFVTFRRFPGGLGPETLAAQERLNPGGDGTVFAARDVDFCYGYPAVNGVAVDGTYRGSILCTMSEEMITEDLVAALFGTQPRKGARDLRLMGPVYYETEAPRWIGGRLFRLTDAEREKGLRHVPWLANTNDPGIPWIRPMRIVPPKP